MGLNRLDRGASRMRDHEISIMRFCYLDAGYLGMGRREERGERKVSWYVAIRRSQHKMLDEVGQSA